MIPIAAAEEFPYSEIELPNSMRALISVSDKTGIVEFASSLQRDFGYEIISTGGTEKAIREAGLKVTAVSDYTGFPEMLEGRVKTLHPHIHGGLLALREDSEHMRELAEQGIELIDMVVVNLYPFEKTAASGAEFHEVIEQIDIGGPSMLRSAAKNFEAVAVIASPSWYPKILAELRLRKGSISKETRKELALEVFSLTARYDASISRYLSEGKRQTLALEQVAILRYGENPHQKGILYRNPSENQDSSIVGSQQLQGKDMSFLNYYDADATLAMVREFEKPTVVMVKHGNPCGIASDSDLAQAFKKALACDPRSAFGVIIGLNRAVNEEIALLIEQEKMFVEVIIAPSFEPEALKILTKKPNIRLLAGGNLRKFGAGDFDLKKISGGFLLQDLDVQEVLETDLNIVTKKKPSKSQIQDMLFAWKVVKQVKSNAIVIAKDQATVGIGAGQMSRVDSVEFSLKKAGERAKGAVLASDAFFPFSDSLDIAAKYGVTSVIQSGGSLNDDQVIKKAEELGISMVFSGKRAFKH